MDLAYNVSENLKSYLDKIEKLRVEILLLPISPRTEIRLKWNSLLEKILWSLSLADNPLSKSNIVSLLSGTQTVNKVKLTNFQKDVINQKKAFNYIKENWLANEAQVTMNVIIKLYEISCKETLGKMSGLTEYSQNRINTVLDYLQKGKDQPIIQAGIAQIELIKITPFDNGNGRVARLLSHLFLYKNGYDVRQMISFEEYFRRDMVTFKRMMDISKIQGNLTLWLEYFAYCVMRSLEKVLDAVKNQKFRDELPVSFWKLSTRQRQILEILDQPGIGITNKEVQKLHRISQITASRDLGKLATLGLLLVHGKGRSVYYTKA